jgi:uncharacterized membrane protein YhaH (DUF805 family)
MTRSKRIAGLVGPTLIALILSEWANPNTWNPPVMPVTYLSGTLFLVAGLATVRAHNHWTRGWPVLVTLVGWFGVVAGLGRMFFPARGAFQPSVALLVTQIVLLSIGLVLTFNAYRRTGDAEASNMPTAPLVASAKA